VVKLRNTHTGDTLCSPKLRRWCLPKVDYPAAQHPRRAPLRSKGDEDKLAVGLATLHQEDPTFHYRVDDEVHQTIVSGQGEIHLQVIVERLQRRFGVNVALEEPLIPYRETIRASGGSKYRHKKQTGGAGQFAEVWLRIEPGPRDSGVVFTQSLVGTNVDRVFVPSVEKGVQTACREGIMAGFRVTDVKVDFYDGKMHPVDSKDIAFQVAGYHAFKEAFMRRPALPAGADLHRGHRAGGIRGRHPRRPFLAPRTDPRGRIRRPFPNHPGPGAAEGALPLQHGGALAHQRPRPPRRGVQTTTAEVPAEMMQKILAERAKRTGHAEEK
jgi:hypothetical protein